MKTGLSDRIRWSEGLGFRLATMLSIALIPLGVIAVAQTSRVVDHAEAIAETALEGRTAAAAAGVRTLIETALGTGQALGTAIIDTGIANAACGQTLGHFRDTTPYVAYVGFAGADGLVTCASDGQARDVSGTRFFQRLRAQDRPLVATSERLLEGGEILAVGQPVVEEGQRLGYMIMAIRPPPFDTGAAPGEDGQSFSIVTFNQDGDLLTATEDTAAAQRLLPQGRSLVDLAAKGPDVFGATAADGSRRLYSVSPIIPGTAYALGSLTRDQTSWGGAVALGTIVFPVAMWLMSMAVAMIAVQRLVLRHISTLRGQMRRFALGDREHPPEVLTEAPAEIREVSQTFHNLTRILMREEKQLAESLQEKTMLLREVHHRVKNNLQLIASIMNMQMRQVQEPAARRVLKSVQDRVASLATIHRNLYQTETLASIRADRLLADIVNQMAILSGVPGQEAIIETDFDEIALVPDQTVPVALLTTEALTNAVKYAAPAAGDGQRRVRVSFKRTADDRVTLCVRNSAAPGGAPAGASGSGLGSRLIAAFAQQLGAEVEQRLDGSAYEVVLTFRVAAGQDLADAPEPAAAAQ